MANKRISDLNFTVSPQLSDVLPIVNSNETKKVAYGTLRDDIRDGLITPADTGSFVVTASLDDHLITFEKADSSTFDILLPGGQGSPTTNHYLVPEILTVSGSMVANLDQAPYTTTAMVYVRWSGAQGTATINLPDATSDNNRYRTIRIIMGGSFASTTKANLTATGGQTLDAGTTYELKKAYEGIMVWSDGSNWIRVQTKA